MTRGARELVAIPLFAIALPACVLWGAGAVLTVAGRSLWMIVHKICRDDNCVCEECRDFDPAFVRSHQAPTVPPTPTDAA